MYWDWEQEQAQKQDQIEKCDEYKRFRSFRRWRAAGEPEDLARDGFVGSADCVSVWCNFCKEYTTLPTWWMGDTPTPNHKSDCCRETNIPMLEDHPLKKYRNVEQRIASFNKPFPIDIVKLAEAGYYYTGEDDCVRCFYCHGGLHNFELDDDPWTLHARYNANCRFMEQNKPDGIKLGNYGGYYPWLCNACFEPKKNVMFYPCNCRFYCESCTRNMIECACCRRKIERYSACAK